MRNIAISLSYDGTSFHGWQIQDALRTVQGTLQSAACTITKEPVKLIGCGRTDTGVHARRYIAGFRTNCEIPIERIPIAFNSLLPDDVAVFAAQEMDDDFHPIRSCIKKEYTYEVYNSKFRNPLLATRAYHFEGDLPLEKLRRAASYFLGEHDFASMRSTGTNVKSTVRCVHSFDIIEHESALSFVICANGFLYNMARTMAGTLFSVALGKISPDEIPDILTSCDRKRAGATAPAHGLYMTDVTFNKLII